MDFNRMPNLNSSVGELNFNNILDNPTISNLNFNLKNNSMQPRAMNNFGPQRPNRIVNRKKVRLKDGRVVNYFLFSSGKGLLLDDKGKPISIKSVFRKNETS